MLKEPPHFQFFRLCLNIDLFCLYDIPHQKITMNLSEKLHASIYSGIVGDALGVPVESTPRFELALCSVKNMLGYGRYDQPQGTWSDDTSMMLCTMESLCKGYDIEDLGNIFCKWIFEAYWTPRGFVFDAGLTTFMALERIRSDKISARVSGCKTEDDNGNGSIMRILPAALFFHKLPLPEFLDKIHEISGITHAHARAQMGCGLYAILVRELIAHGNSKDGYAKMIETGRKYYESSAEFKAEVKHFDRILSGAIPKLQQEDINSTGYVIDTLEAAIWCLFRNNDTKNILLSAVNLGLDTDTTGMVAGGLAGLVYGMGSIPEEWLSSLARKAEIDPLIASFVAKAAA
jgi:ADP-ribosyl-[dinitrogen reductase] hydrolase